MEYKMLEKLLETVAALNFSPTDLIAVKMLEYNQYGRASLKTADGILDLTYDDELATWVLVENDLN